MMHGPFKQAIHRPSGLAHVAVACWILISVGCSANEQPTLDSLLTDSEQQAAVRARDSLPKFRAAIDTYIRESYPSDDWQFSVEVLAGENETSTRAWIQLDMDYEQYPEFIGKIIEIKKSLRSWPLGQTVRQKPELILDWRILSPEEEQLGSSIR